MIQEIKGKIVSSLDQGFMKIIFDEPVNFLSTDELVIEQEWGYGTGTIRIYIIKKEKTDETKP